MFLPIILDPYSFSKDRYLWAYQKNLFHAFENKSAIISHRRFSDYRNVFSEEFRRLHGFRMLDKNELEQVPKYFIPDSLFDNLAKEKGSQLAAKIFLQNERYEPLEEITDGFIQSMIKDNNKPEGIFCWAAAFKSIRYLAEKYDIPLITAEFSLRFPNYRSMCYFCFDDIYSENEIKERYEKFGEVKKKLGFNLFTREELLTMFLDNSTVDYIKMYKKKPEYKLGIAGVHPVATTFFAKSMYTDLELIQDLREYYDDKDILFRKHPGEEPYQATYRFVNLDTHKSPVPFILKSERIAAQGSNVLFEAMLWGKGVYSHDVSPFAQFSERDYSNRSPKPVSEDFLNFVLFSYFAPMEKLWDYDYLKWRSEKPSEYEIFMKNLNIYLSELGLGEDILMLSAKQRSACIKKARNI